MSILKSIWQKLIVAAVSGILIMVFVYFKDKYLAQDDSDVEILQEITHSKAQKATTPAIVEEPKAIKKEIIKEKTIVKEDIKKIEAEDKTEDEEAVEIEVVVPDEEIVEKHDDPVAVKEEIITKKETTTYDNSEQSFEDFQNSMTFPSSQKDAFDELDSETN